MITTSGGVGIVGSSARRLGRWEAGPRSLLIAVLGLAILPHAAGNAAITGNAVITKIADARQNRGSGAAAVELVGVITGFSGWKNSFFLQDATGGISIDRLENTKVSPGDEVAISGELRPGLFAPILLSRKIRVMGHRDLPRPKETTYDELASGAFDSRLVEVTGILSGAHAGEMWGRKILLLDLHTPKGTITIHVLDYAKQDFERLVDSTIRIKGVCGTIFNDRRQLVGLRVFVSDFKQIAVVEAGIETSELPVSPLSSLMKFKGPLLDHRVKVTGSVTYQAGRNLFFLQQGDWAIRVQSLKDGAWQPGLQVNASGFVSNSGYLMTMRGAVVETVGRQSPLKPVRITPGEVIKNENGFTQAPYNGLLVELQGEVAELLPSSGSQLWAVRSGPILFQAQLRGAASGGGIALEPGTRVKFTGICIAAEDENEELQSFRILLGSPADIREQKAPNWSSSLLLLLAILLLVLVGSAILWLVHRRRNQSFPREVEERESVKLEASCLMASRILSGCAVALGGIVAAGWATDLPWLRLADSQSGMMPNTALAILAGGVAIWFQNRAGSRPVGIIRLLGAGVAGTIGALTLFEFATSRNLGIDLLLVRNVEYLSGSLDPGRMAIATALCLVLTGCAIGFLGYQRLIGLGQVLAIASGAMGLLNLIAYLYGTRATYGAGAHVTMALATGAALLALSAAVLLARPDCGVMKTIWRSGSGGLMARSLIPVAIVGPILLGWVRLQGQLAGLYGTRFGLALFALSNVICFGFVIWNGAAILNRLDEARSLAERSLRERDRRLEMVFETASVGDWSWDAVKDELTAHRVVWKLYGDPGHRGSEPAIWFLERQHPEDAEMIARELAAAIAEQRPLDVEFRVVQPDGSVRWLGCRATSTCDESGKLLQVTGINFDVTDRKLAEIRVRRSEELFRELADAMPQMVWTMRADGSIDYYNRRWYEYTGSSFETPWAQNIHPDDLEVCQNLITTSLREGSPFELEVRLKRADGQYRWHLSRAIPVTNEHGEVERLFGTSTDIDEFKRASAELSVLNEKLAQRVQKRSAQLADSEWRHRLLVEGVKDYAIYMLNADGTVATWNAGAEKMSGYEASEVMGRHFSIFFGSEEVQNNRPQRELKVAAKRAKYQGEGLHVRKDGSSFWASALVTAIRTNQEVRGFSIIVRDLTEQRRAEQLLVAEQQRAEEANRAKSSFLAAMSHEIRTPMNAILGMADLLWETELSAVQKEYVRRFRRAGTTLLTLINDILDFSKIESGRFELEAVEFDLSDTVERTMELMTGRAAAKNIELSARVSPGTPARMVGDPSRLQQVLNNLIGNAIKFTEKGTVALTVGKHPDNRPGHLEFAVSDSGIGIPADKLSAIFEDFTQAESSTTRRFGGTGLGLGICRRLVNRMGGELTVESVLQKGSTFRFDVVLPSAEGTVGSEAEAGGELSGRGIAAVESGLKRPSGLEGAGKEAMKILIAEDSDDNRFLLEQYLKGLPYEITFAENGKEAVELFDSRDFDFVLMDVQMPVMDGLSATIAIRELERERRLKRTPIVALTANALVEDAQRSEAAGCSGHLTKPISKDTLIAAIKKFQNVKSQDKRDAKREDLVEDPPDLVRMS